MTYADISLPMTGPVLGVAQTFKKSDFHGQFVVLYFYPKDNTPGCTTESIAFRDAMADFTAAGAVIFGVSRDSMRSHDNFKTKLALPFELICDADELLCTQFDVIKQKMMYGKSVRGIERSTFLFAPDGSLLTEWRKVKAANHVPEVLATLLQHKQATL